MAGSGTAHLRSEGNTLLRAENLVVEFPVGKTGLKVHAVSDVSLDVREGETLGLVGESGCGKSTTGRALMQLPRPNSGTVVYRDLQLTALAGEDLRRVRPEMQMIFQDPISSLNPRRRVRDIVGEPLKVWAADRHPPAGAVKLAANLLLAAAALMFVLFGLLCVFWLVNTLFREMVGYTFQLLPGFYDWLSNSNLPIFLSAVLWAPALVVLGINLKDRSPTARTLTFVETGVALVLAVLTLRSGPFHPAELIVVVAAVASILATVMLVTPPAIADFRTMADVHRDHEQIVRRVLTDVGIDPDGALDRRPHQFSGGQCQRICIARALVLDPKLIICDEPVSALDVSVQAQILNLLEEMKQRYGLTLVFIAHDLAVVKNVSDRVAVMYLGKMCEVAPPDDLYAKPAHPYTAALLTSIPVPDPSFRPDAETILGGEIPSPVAPPTGCRFRTRCPRAQDMCAQVEPKMRQVGLGHYVACHFPLDIEEGRALAAPRSAAGRA